MMDARPDQIVDFNKMVRAGESPRMAEMLALRAAPRLDTDTAHFAGLDLKHFAKVNGQPLAQKAFDQARKAGINVNENWFYNGSIADERGGGDPDAWVGPGEGKSKLKESVRKKGGACESLGVEFGDSAHRMDTEQKRLEKVRAKKKQYKLLQKQVGADMKPQPKV